MKYYRNRWKRLLWEAEIDCDESDVMDEHERLEETYTSAKVDCYQDEDHWPYPWYMTIRFENEEDEMEFMLRESL